MGGETHSMPRNWKRKTLAVVVGDDGLLTDGDWVETKDQDPNGDVRLIQLADVRDGTYANKSARFMTLERAQELRCTFLNRNDILVARMPDPLGRACLFPGDAKKAVTVVDICIVRPGDSVDRRWLLDAINESGFRRSVQSRATGTTRVRISRKHLSRIHLAVPPIGEQRRIAEVLVSIDTAIERTRAVIAQVRVVKQALLSDLMTNGLPGRHKKFKTVKGIGRIPAAWDVARLQSVALKQRGTFTNGPFGSDLLTSEFVPSGVPVLYIQDIRDRKYARITSIFVTPEKAASLPACSVLPDDVLIAKVGDPPCAAAVYPTGELAGVITQDLIRIRTCPKQASPDFLAALLNSRTGQAQVRRIVIRGTRERVSLTDFKRIVIPLPPIDEQASIAGLIVSTDARIEASLRELGQFTKLKSALSDALLTGRVRVTVGKEAVAR